DLGGGRRWADEIEGDAAEERSFVRAGRRLQAFLLQGRQNEVVDWRSGPVLVLYRRQGDIPQRLERPVLAPFLEVKITFFNVAGNLVIGPEGAPFDPCDHVGDLVGAQLAARRHLQIAILVAYRLEKEALLRRARDDGGSALAALQEPGTAVQPQFRLRLLHAVAFVAVFREERADFLLEELDPLAGGLVAAGA